MPLSTRFFSRLFSRPPSSEAGLAVLAYHRVGDRSKAAYDPWVYTTDAEQLDEHIG